MSDAIKHECGIAHIRLLKPLEFYKKKYGTAFYGIIDNSHPLAFGVPDRLYTLKQSVSALMPNPSLQTVGYYHKDPMKLKVSGYASVENRKLLAGKTFAAVSYTHLRAHET